MRTLDFLGDQRGTSAIELSLVAPLFGLFMAGIAQVGIWVWTSTALQHGAELAARCATFNPTACADANSITNYAVAQSYGVRVTPSSFTYSQPACGNQVSASIQTANFLSIIGAPAMTATAQACFPK